MHGAHLVPVRRVRREIAGRLVGAGLADLGEPRAVGGEMRVGRREPATRSRAKPATGPVWRDSKEHPRALAMALDEPGFDEEFQMARDARLRLAENGHELADREFGFGEKGEQAQARGFAGRGRGGENGVERDVAWHGVPASVCLT